MSKKTIYIIYVQGCLKMQNSNMAVLLESDTNELEIVEFRIDECDEAGNVVPCYYGVNVAKVREIIRLPHLWKVLNSHPAIPGMIKLRDRVHTVIDLSVMLNKKVGSLKADRVIVLEFNRLVVAVLVHSVSRIYRISWEQVEPPVKTGHSSQVTGLVKMDNRIILVLDFEKIVGELYREYALNDNPLLLTEVSEEQALDRSRINVLVADDSPFIRNTICSTLRKAGYTVIEAENGEEAWEIVKAKQEMCRQNKNTITDELSLLITDIEMPKMDGLHLTSRIKREDELKALPIIIFSSMASDDNIRKWQDLGAAGILTKPDLPNLVEMADRLVLTQ
jgi:two-component system chemotaxis response regulator CheV